jgi:hypothetical protein
MFKWFYLMAEIKNLFFTVIFCKGFYQIPYPQNCLAILNWVHKPVPVRYFKRHAFKIRIVTFLQMFVKRNIFNYCQQMLFTSL